MEGWEIFLGEDVEGSESQKEMDLCPANFGIDLNLTGNKFDSDGRRIFGGINAAASDKFIIEQQNILAI